MSAMSTTNSARATLAQHLLDLGFYETTQHDYAARAGYQDFQLAGRQLTAHLSPGKITVRCGQDWHLEAKLLPEALLTAMLAAAPALPPTAPLTTAPARLPPLG